MAISRQERQESNGVQVACPQDMHFLNIQFPKSYYERDQFLQLFEAPCGDAYSIEPNRLEFFPLMFELQNRLTLHRKEDFDVRMIRISNFDSFYGKISVTPNFLMEILIANIRIFTG